MTLITPETKLADAIHSNYMIIPIVNRFGIRLGFGDKIIDEICTEHGVDADFFVAILNTFTFSSYFSKSRLKSFSISQWVDYLRRTHVYYREVELPIIEIHLKKLTDSIKDGDGKSLELVSRFFFDYKAELTAHLSREDSITFPYIEELLQVQHSPNAKDEYAKLATKYSIKEFESEHDNVDEKLFDLKNILIKYISDSYDQSLCNAVIFELTRLENDLKDHTRLENEILVPLAEELEQSIKQDTVAEK